MTPEDQLKRAQNSHQWFSPTLFITFYGKWGVKLEAECYRHNADGSIETESLNIDGCDYQDAKQRFWKLWNKEHAGARLSILKSLGSYGL